MTLTTTPPSRWRRQWAERENARRQRAHTDAMATWQHQEATWQWLRELAETFQPQTPSVPVEWHRLTRGETVYWSAGRVVLLETAAPPAMQNIDQLSLSPYPPPAATAHPLPAGDLGSLVVTSKRVIFNGHRNRREWTFRKLSGLAQLSDSGILLWVSNRKRVSGLRTQPADALAFRCYLAIALADSMGNREELAQKLASQHTAHQQRKPKAPTMAVPGEAPTSAWFTAGKMTTSALLAVVLFGVCCVSGALLPAGAPSEPEGLTSDPQALVSPTMTPGPTPSPSPIPTSSPSPSPTASPTEASLPPSEPVTEQAAPPPPAPPPPPVDLCGAPQNPYGYNYCGNGSHITNPPSDICSYFDCIPNFWNGKGYMMQCQSDKVSKSGGRSGSCSHHGGNRQPVYG